MNDKEMDKLEKEYNERFVSGKGKPQHLVDAPKVVWAWIQQKLLDAKIEALTKLGYFYRSEIDDMIIEHIKKYKQLKAEKERVK